MLLITGNPIVKLVSANYTLQDGEGGAGTAQTGQGARVQGGFASRLARPDAAQRHMLVSANYNAAMHNQ